MNVIAWSENLTQAKADEAAEGMGLERGTFKAVSKAELFQQADVISLHYVLSPRSRGIVGAGELGMMKRSAVLVNSSRGPLIDESALLETLQKGGIRGAALDVWWQEPLPQDSPWRKYSGKSELVMSPHMGYVNEGELGVLVVMWILCFCYGCSTDARAGTINRWYEEQAENVRRFIAGDDLLNRLN